MATPVSLAPKPGFVIKTLTSAAGYYIYPATDKGISSSSTSKSESKSNQNAGGLLEPTKSPPRVLPIAKDMKVFINIAWDANVPAPPPDVDEATIRRAMMGEDMGDGTLSGEYYIPIVVSEPREDVDKAGKPSLVFDAILNPVSKPRVTKDENFRMYIIELCLEHVEDRAKILLSRQIAQPNIAVKGKLHPRVISIPNRLLKKGDGAEAQVGATTGSTKKPLIEVISPVESGTAVKKDVPKEVPKAEKPKSAIKPSSTPATKATLLEPTKTQESTLITPAPKPPAAKSEDKAKRPLIEELSSMPTPTKTESLPPPKWTWVKDGEGRIVITFQIPGMTRDLHKSSTLDIESRRILLHIPSLYHLDINLTRSDKDLSALKTDKILDALPAGDRGEAFKETMKLFGENAGEAMRLNKERALDVEGARAEWRVGEGRLVVRC